MDFISVCNLICGALVCSDLISVTLAGFQGDTFSDIPVFFFLLISVLAFLEVYHSCRVQSVFSSVFGAKASSFLLQRAAIYNSQNWFERFFCFLGSVKRILNRL